MIKRDNMKTYETSNQKRNDFEVVVNYFGQRTNSSPLYKATVSKQQLRSPNDPEGRTASAATTWRLIHKGLPSNNLSITSFAMTRCSPKMRESNVASRADVHPSTVQSELTQGSEVQRKFRGPILRQQNKLCLERRNF